MENGFSPLMMIELHPRHLSGMKGWVKWAARVVLLWRNGLQGHWTNKMEAQSNRIKRQTDSSLMYLFPFFIFYRFYGFYFSLFSFSVSPLSDVAFLAPITRFYSFLSLFIIRPCYPTLSRQTARADFWKDTKKRGEIFRIERKRTPKNWGKQNGWQLTSSQSMDLFGWAL